LKSTETTEHWTLSAISSDHFSNFGSLKSTETRHRLLAARRDKEAFQQFRLVEEH